MKLVNVAEMKAIEQEANQKGVSYENMMERAGKGIAEVIKRYAPIIAEKQVVALVGGGNNGGDAILTLLELHEAGCKGYVYLARQRENDPLIVRLQASGIEIGLYEQDSEKRELFAALQNADFVIDGLLGTGIKLPLKPEFADIIAAVNAEHFHFKVISVDCPSGIDCDTGEVAADCITADITVCLQAIKVGLLTFPAYQYVGILEVVDLHLPPGLEAEIAVNREVATAECVAKLLPKRPLQAHKGTFGTAMIIAGSINYTGAAHLAGHAAYRIGAGLVQMAIPGPIYAALAGQFPEATWLLLPHEMGVIHASAAKLVLQHLEKVTAILIGPGWGVEDTTREFLEKLISGKMQSERKRSGIGFVMMDADEEIPSKNLLPPMVIDADGLKLLAKLNDWPLSLPQKTILTPHPGEMSVLTGLTVAEIQNKRMEIACKYARDWGHVLVLKGALTIVAAPDGRTCINPIANPALARAGTGDVLAGIITGMLAQGIPQYEAAVAAVWIHAQAGIEASEKVGHPASVLAGDVVDAIPRVLSHLG